MALSQVRYLRSCSISHFVSLNSDPHLAIWHGCFSEWRSSVCEQHRHLSRPLHPCIMAAVACRREAAICRRSGMYRGSRCPRAPCELRTCRIRDGLLQGSARKSLSISVARSAGRMHCISSTKRRNTQLSWTQFATM
eukprot:s4903_g7.t1